MKKHLIAAAVAAAVAVPAMAQNVTFDGVIDAALSRSDAGGSTATTGSFVGATRNVFSTTQYNIRGSEDLGGGLKAGFRLSQQFNSLSGATTTGPDSTDGFNEATVTLSGGFGSVSIGLQDVAGKEAFGYGRFSNFGRTAGALYVVGDERNGTINYSSPVISGFHFAIGHATATASGDPAAGALGKTNGIGIGYTQGPLKVGANVTRGDRGDADGVNVTAEDRAFGAQYDFGAVAVAGSYQTHDLDKTVSGKKSLTTVSGILPMGNGVKLMAAYLKYKDNTVSDTDNTATGYQLGVTKDLSKRTFLYAVYSDLDQKANASYGMRGLYGTPAAGNDPSNFALGINHKF